MIYRENGPLAVHDEADCEGSNCAIHNPSQHHMRFWPLNIRLDTWWMLGERMCEHNVGHPDPDSVEYIWTKYRERFDKDEEKSGLTIHGCCSGRCCVDPEKEKK